MADFETNRFTRTQADATGAIDAGLRKYMLQVYNYMLLALIVTGLTAYAVYAVSVTTNPTEAVGQLGPVLITRIGALLFTSPIGIALAFGPLIVSLFIYNRIRSVSLGGAQMWFWSFAILVGASMATIFMFFKLPSIAEVFFITAAAFGGLSLWGYSTKRDLSPAGSFLVMGMWGIIIAMAVNYFFNSPAIQWALSIAGVGIFAGLVAYYTQAIKEMYYAGDDDAIAAKKSILGALALYISFVNMFRFLLFLIGGRR